MSTPTTTTEARLWQRRHYRTSEKLHDWRLSRGLTAYRAARHLGLELTEYEAHERRGATKADMADHFPPEPGW